jgi:hypothetical protein
LDVPEIGERRRELLSVDCSLVQVTDHVLQSERGEDLLVMFTMIRVLIVELVVEDKLLLMSILLELVLR